MYRYAGIGSRKTPNDVLDLIKSIGRIYALYGWVLRSGAALGADRAFEYGCDSILGQKEIFRVEDTQHNPQWAFDTVDRYHPAPEKLSEYAKRLMARNAMIVLGQNGDHPVRKIVCYTHDGLGGGGTGQALRIAADYSIPVYDLGDINVELKIREDVHSREFDYRNYINT